MNEPQPHARISRRIIIKDIAYGILLFICLMLVYVPLGLLLSSATPETLEPGSIAFIYLVMFIVYTIIVFLAVPIIVAIFLIRDITRIIKDLDPIAWYKRWYRILAFCALILILIMVVLGLGASGGFQTKPVGFSIVNVVAGEHSVQVTPSVAGEGLIHVIKVSFLIISLTIIA